MRLSINRYLEKLDDEGYNQVFKMISKEALKITTKSIQYHDYFQYRIGYLWYPQYKLFFIFVLDLCDKIEKIKKGLEKCDKFMGMFEALLDRPLGEQTLSLFDPAIEMIHKADPKNVTCWIFGVGKTTITRLIMMQEIPVEHVPTIQGDIAKFKIGKIEFHLWDFAGQKEFSYLWEDFRSWI